MENRHESQEGLQTSLVKDKPATNREVWGRQEMYTAGETMAEAMEALSPSYSTALQSPREREMARLWHKRYMLDPT